jgi:hypothetical protein
MILADSRSIWQYPTGKRDHHPSGKGVIAVIAFGGYDQGYNSAEQTSQRLNFCLRNIKMMLAKLARTNRTRTQQLKQLGL